MAYRVRNVPQNIMQYELKIFEFMSVKQFFILFAVIAFCIALFYLLPGVWNIVVPGFILILSLIALFMPFNGEPFHVFISNFLDALVEPQVRVWHKKGIVLKSAAEKALYYTYGEEIPLSRLTNFVNRSGDNQARTTNQGSELDRLESDFLSRSSQLEKELSQMGNKGKFINSAGNNLTHTTNIPSDVFGSIQLNSPNKNTSSESTTSSYIKRESEIIDESLKNYIFGYVEDQNETPIQGATVVIKKANQDEKLEILNTNSAGEFKTYSEYPEGQYNITVFYNGDTFRDLVIYHNPVDPVPVIVSPKVEEDVNKTEIQDDVVSAPETTVDGTFIGEYNFDAFSVENLLSTELDIDNKALVDQKDVSFRQETVSQNSDSVVKTGGVSYEFPVDFLSLPDMDVNFARELDTSLIYLFNTLNGVVVDGGNNPISGVQISIWDRDGKLVNSCISNELGYFYSISPIPDGDYVVIAKNGTTMRRFFVEMNGKVIKPKVIILK